MAIPQKAIDALQAGAEYMPGVPMKTLTELEAAEALSAETKHLNRKPAKGSDAAKERMKELRERRGKTPKAKGTNEKAAPDKSDSKSKDSGPLGILPAAALPKREPAK